MEKLTVSVEEAGKMLGVSRQTAYRLSRSEDFPKLRIGRRVLIPIAELRVWTTKNSSYKLDTDFSR
jgi:excisionase family DNA binding protein